MGDTATHLLVCELLAQVGHDVAELRSADEAVAVLVEHLQAARGTIHQLAARVKESPINL